MPQVVDPAGRTWTVTMRSVSPPRWRGWRPGARRRASSADSWGALEVLGYSDLPLGVTIAILAIPVALLLIGGIVLPLALFVIETIVAIALWIGTLTWATMTRRPWNVTVLSRADRLEFRVVGWRAARRLQADLLASIATTGIPGRDTSDGPSTPLRSD